MEFSALAQNCSQRSQVKLENVGPKVSSLAVQCLCNFWEKKLKFIDYDLLRLWRTDLSILSFKGHFVH